MQGGEHSMWLDVIGDVMTKLVIPSLVTYKTYIEIRNIVKEQKAKEEKENRRLLNDGKKE